VGRLLRELLLGQHRLPDGAPADGRAMALLFAADRRDHLRREVEPALAAGMDVVCDRYLLSSLAYQGEEAERDWVAQLAREVRPADLTLLLDLPVAVAAARRRAAGRIEERYDADAVQERVAAAYRALVAGDSKAVTIDARASIDDVTRAITDAVDRLL
jgi:dTMP kinase